MSAIFTAITAMAASPWTSLLAVAGQHQILLYDTETKELAGILPYAEGYARSLKFSANGSLLILGGGIRVGAAAASPGAAGCWRECANLRNEADATGAAGELVLTVEAADEREKLQRVRVGTVRARLVVLQQHLGAAPRLLLGRGAVGAQPGRRLQA